MSIQIDTVRICGFRGISNIEISLPRITVLFGQNNAGKTSVIKALQLALGDYARYLSDEDFYIGKDEKRQESITIDLRFIAIENGVQVSEFSKQWIQEFGEGVQNKSETSQQFVAIRTRVTPDIIQGEYKVDRFFLKDWPKTEEWQEAPFSYDDRLKKRLKCISYISVDAQRDIHSELKEKSSYIGRVLSRIKSDKADVERIEHMMAEINKETVGNSQILSVLKKNLDQLNKSFSGSGRADLAAFPKSFRDIPKYFNVLFGESEQESLPMEYHGMGTRSWASILTVKAFIELLAEEHEKEEEPFFPIVAIEEPEAHLHPNGQKTLFTQLSESLGQVIISTHSPYLLGMASLKSLRGLVKASGTTQVSKLINDLDEEDINILQREVMRFRGELLFSKVIVLAEGVTEELIFPAMFKVRFKETCFELGVNCISVGGKSYSPFVKLALSFGIPVCIISDNDKSAKSEIESQINKIEKISSLNLSEDNFFLSFLSDGNDIEAELLNVLKLRDEVVEALIKTKTRGSSSAEYTQKKADKLSLLDNDSLLRELRSSKASYAGFLANIIVSNFKNKPPESFVPLAVSEAFDRLEKWL